MRVLSIVAVVIASSLCMGGVHASSSPSSPSHQTIYAADSLNVATRYMGMMQEHGFHPMLKLVSSQPAVYEVSLPEAEAVAYLAKLQCDEKQAAKEREEKQKKKEAIQIENQKIPSRECLAREWGLLLKGEFLYWQMAEEDIAYTVDADIIVVVPTAMPPKEAILSPDFKWEPGGRFELGAYFPYDAWSVALMGTFLHGKGDASVNANAFKLVDFFGNDSPPVTEASTRWRSDFYIANLNLQKDFWVGKCLAVKPFVGLQGAFPRRHWTIQYAGIDTADLPGPGGHPIPLKLITTSHGWNVGPQLGIDMRWKFPVPLSLGFLVSGAILYSDMHHSLGSTQFVGGQPPVYDPNSVVRLIYHQRKIIDMCRVWVGLNSSYCVKNVNLQWEAGYEFQLWEGVLLTNVPLTTYNGNFSMQGLTASLMIGF